MKQIVPARFRLLNFYDHFCTIKDFFHGIDNRTTSIDVFNVFETRTLASDCFNQDRMSTINKYRSVFRR